MNENHILDLFEYRRQYNKSTRNLDINNEEIRINILDLYHIQSPFRFLGVQYLLKYSPFTYDCLDSIIHILLFRSHTSDIQPFNEILYWINKFKTKTTEDTRVLSPYSILLTFWNSFHSKQLKYEKLQVLISLINNNYNISIRQLKFYDDKLSSRCDYLNLPDSIWIAAMAYSENDALPILLSYWNTHPLGLLLIFDPDSENRSVPNELFFPNALQIWIIRTINIFRILLKTGGILPQGTNLYNKIIKHLQYLNSFENEEFNENVYLKFKQIHRKIPSLKHLCRFKIRSLLENGNQLPETISSIIHPNLKLNNYMNLYEICEDY